jgi:NTP pyrophosphatase (non-canonical NTP hydrolase)
MNPAEDRRHARDRHLKQLTKDELLVILIEECGEVIQAATKCLRFGFDRSLPDYGVNSEVLAQEVGDVLGIVYALELDLSIITYYKQQKLAKAEYAKIAFGHVLGSD